MKVLMIGQLPVEAGGTYTTGVCNVVYELSKCATDNVQLVVYATNFGKREERINKNCVFKGSLIRPINIAVRFFSHPITFIKQWRYYKKALKKYKNSPIRYDSYRDNIERVIKEEKPDIIHCMNKIQMASSYFANSKYHLPLVLTMHGCADNTANNSIDGTMVKLADVVTGLTPLTISSIKSHGVEGKKIEMVPNGTDTSKFYFSHTERDLLRKELGVDDETTVMLTIGSLQHRKGQLTMLSKFKELPEDFNYLYLIIGKGEDEERIKEYIKENNLQKKVRVIGYVANTELYRYHSAADIYIHCSRLEGQALSEVEAYATDLKIALNRDIVGTVITDTTNTDDYWIFDFDNFDGLEFIKWASEHKINRNTRGLYDWKNIFELYSEVYKKMLVQ